MPVTAGGIASADNYPVEIGMIVVSENGYETVLVGKRVDLLKGLFWPGSAVNEIPQVDQEINRSEFFLECRTCLWWMRVPQLRLNPHERQKRLRHP